MRSSILTNKECQMRLKEEIRKIFPVLAILIAYSIYLRFFTIGIPCVFHEVTGLKCPGCGMTRSCMSILKFDFTSAYNSNMLSITVVPMLLIIMGIAEVRYIMTGKRKTTLIEAILLGILFLVTISYGILRNVL